MSRTDKDRPYRVQNAEHGIIDHDHRSGACVIAGVNDTWADFRNHHRRCAKRRVIEYTCTKAEPNLDWKGKRTCWFGIAVFGELWEYTQCDGHTRIEWDDAIPCICDDRPPRPTCFPAWVYGRAWSGGVPTEFVREYYHAPERRRVNGALHDARRDFNTGVEDDWDYDVDNRQARNSCRWLYW